MDIDEEILNNKGLVYSQLHRFNLVNNQEAESYAFEALYKAIQTFDTTKDIALSTYATVCIYNALGSYLRSYNRKRQLCVVSYHTVIDESNCPYLLFLKSTCDTEEYCIKQELYKEVRRIVAEQIDKLSNKKHAQIIRAWKNSDFTASTVDIAIITHVSQSYVSQIINVFKYSIKKQLEDIIND